MTISVPSDPHDNLSAFILPRCFLVLAMNTANILLT